MQIFGVSSLFLCVLTMFLIYTGYQNEAFWVFGVGPVAADRFSGTLHSGDTNLSEGIGFALSNMEEEEKDKSTPKSKK